VIIVEFVFLPKKIHIHIHTHTQQPQTHQERNQNRRHGDTRSVNKKREITLWTSSGIYDGCLGCVNKNNHG